MQDSTNTADYLKLNTPWTYGHIQVTYHDPDDSAKVTWDVHPYRQFFTVEDMWKVLNNTMYRVTTVGSKKLIEWKYLLKSWGLNEVYFFRYESYPKWEFLKANTAIKSVCEMKISNPSDKFVQSLILLVIGETIASAENIIGVRIKPSSWGGDVRLWITDINSFDKIEGFLQGIWNEEPTTAKMICTKLVLY